MVERILSFIKSKNLTPSQFADEIGVQRSGISHLISGRNKPSLEFIQRIVSRYPEINVQWILTGAGSMTNDGSLREEMNFDGRTVPTSIPTPLTADKGRQKKPKSTDIEGKNVEKITIFFKDRTFRDYYPE